MKLAECEKNILAWIGVIIGIPFVLAVAVVIFSPIVDYLDSITIHEFITNIKRLLFNT